MRATGFPNGRRGYVVDRIRLLACGGADAPSNMQWQTIAAAKAKDSWERAGCGAAAFSARRSTPSIADVEMTTPRSPSRGTTSGFTRAMAAMPSSADAPRIAANPQRDNGSVVNWGGADSGGLVVPQLVNRQRATVLATAGIVVLPDASRQPLRTVTPGTSLVVIQEDGGWTQVQFDDPQFGLRSGYVESTLIRVERASDSR